MENILSDSNQAPTPVSAVLNQPWLVLRHVPITILLSTIALLLMWVPSIASILEYRTESSGTSQLIRALSSHLVHWSWNHLFWDLFMFLSLGVICENRSRLGTYSCLAISGLLIPILSLTVNSNVDSYRGLSGLDTALFSLACTIWLLDALREREISTCLMVATAWLALLSKISYESYTGQSLFVDTASSQFTPVHIAHVFGGLIGTATGLVIVVSNLSKSAPRPIQNA